MKTKKIFSKILIGLCAVSIIALIIVFFAGCNAINVNKNSYEMEIDYNASLQTLNCNEKVKYVNTSDTTLNYLAFHLYPNAFREESIVSPVSFNDQHKAYPNGLSYGNININSVSVSNNIATYSNTMQIVHPTYSNIDNLIKNNEITSSTYFIGGEDENILYILFPNALYPNDEISVSINFTVHIPNINHRFGYGNNTVNLGNFYPIACVFDNGEFDTSLYNSSGDPFFSDMANYIVTIKVPTSFVIANTGYIIEKEQATIEELDYKDTNNKEIEETEMVFVEKNVFKIKADNVRDFAMVLSEEFKVISQKLNNTEVKYYYFSDDNPELSLETSIKSLETFNEMIGKYPYSTLSVVEANFVHGGMEYPNLVYISNDVTDESVYQQVIIHEIAHQWWYNLVGNNEVSHSWLDEGLTEYTTALFYETHKEYNVSKESLIRTAYVSYDLFVEFGTKIYGNVDTSMNRDLDEFNNEQEYVHMAYVKGMLLFDSLREILGYKTFLKCLQNYFSAYCYRIATPEDMIASFEKTSGRDLESYFNAWISGNIILLK
jgi:hypothetical protein